MKLKSIVEFHEGAPGNATHVLKMNDNYEYANFNGRNYNSCDNSAIGDALSNPAAACNDWFFKVSKHDWQIHLVLR